MKATHSAFGGLTKDEIRTLDITIRAGGMLCSQCPCKGNNVLSSDTC